MTLIIFIIDLEGIFINNKYNIYIIYKNII